jgi:DNA-binding response OmpR family regulator
MSHTPAEHVMIADPEAGVRQLLSSALHEVQIQVDQVADAQVMTEYLAIRRYAVIVVDASLIGTESSVLTLLGAMSRTDRPVVLVLAHSPETTRSLDTDVVQIVLRKPVAIAQLVGLIRSCVRNVALRPQPPTRPDQDQLTS